MPKGGFKSITMREQYYDKIQSVFNAHKEQLGAVGITSVSGLCAMLTNYALEKNPTLGQVAMVNAQLLEGHLITKD